MADRLVNYGDATAAFAIVNSLAFLLALSEAEVRCSLVEQASLVYGGLVAFALVFSIVVVACHRAEGRIRAPGEPLAKDLQVLRRAFFWARIVAIWLANIGSIPLVSLALGDSGCTSPAA